MYLNTSNVILQWTLTSLILYRAWNLNTSNVILQFLENEVSFENQSWFKYI